MKVDLNFGLGELVDFFRTSPASHVYKTWYFNLHSGYQPNSAGGIPIHRLSLDLTNQIINIYEETTGVRWFDHLEEEMECLDLRTINLYPCAKAKERIIELAGEEIKPHIEEFELLSKYRNSFDFLLMHIYCASTQNCPQEIKEKIHSDKRGCYGYEFDEFTHWLEAHPEDDNFPISDQLRKRITKLYHRMLTLSRFYNDDREAEFYDKDNENRILLFDEWNTLFKLE